MEVLCIGWSRGRGVGSEPVMLCHRESPLEGFKSDIRGLGAKDGGGGWRECTAVWGGVPLGAGRVTKTS